MANLENQGTEEETIHRRNIACAIFSILSIAIGVALIVALSAEDIATARHTRRETRCIYVSNNRQELEAEYAIATYYNNYTSEGVIPKLYVKCNGTFGLFEGSQTRTVYRNMNPAEVYKRSDAYEWIHDRGSGNSTISVYFDSYNPSGPLFYSDEWTTRMWLGIIGFLFFISMSIPFLASVITMTIDGIIKFVRHIHQCIRDDDKAIEMLKQEGNGEDMYLKQLDALSIATDGESEDRETLIPKV